MKYLASDYFSRLFKLSSGVEVTSRDGKDLGFDEGVLRVVRELTYIKRNRRKLLVIGAGASHSIASRFVNDLQEGLGIRAMLFAEPTRVTDLAENFGYDNTFDHQLRQWVDPKDLVVAICPSGDSPSLLKAVERAIRMEARVVTLTGFAADNPMRSLGLLNVYAPSDSSSQVELMYAILTQYMADTSAELVHDPDSADAMAWADGNPDDEKPKQTYKASNKGHWVRRSRSSS